MAGKKKHLCKVNPDKKWGGVRANPPRPSKWKHRKTKAIYVPEVLADKIRAYAHQLDAGQDLAEELKIVQERLNRAEKKLGEIEPFLRIIERRLVILGLIDLSKDSARITDESPAENPSVFVLIPPQSRDNSSPLF